MADGKGTWQPGRQIPAREGVAHIAHVPLGVETIAVDAGDAAGFLSPVLEGVEPQGGDGGSVLNVKYAEHAAF